MPIATKIQAELNRVDYRGHHFFYSEEHEPLVRELKDRIDPPYHWWKCSPQISQETQQIEAHQQQKAMDELLNRLQEISDAKPETHSNHYFILDAKMALDGNDSAYRSIMTAAAQTALQKGADQVAVALLPLTPKKDAIENEVELEDSAEDEVQATLERFGCTVYRDLNAMIASANLKR